MDAGLLDKRVAFLRRPAILDNEGEDTGRRGDYAPVFTLWARFRPESAREAAQGGRAQNVETGTLTVRDGARSRTITNADRVLVQERDFAITGAGLPDRRTGFIIFNITSNLGGE